MFLIESRMNMNVGLIVHSVAGFPCRADLATGDTSKKQIISPLSLVCSLSLRVFGSLVQYYIARALMDPIAYNMSYFQGLGVNINAPFKSLKIKKHEVFVFKQETNLHIVPNFSTHFPCFRNEGRQLYVSQDVGECKSVMDRSSKQNLRV